VAIRDLGIFLDYFGKVHQGTPWRNICSRVNADWSQGAPTLVQPRRFRSLLEGIHRFLGRPPFLPHCESFFLCLRIVTLPPFLPMHRGQIMRVRGCSGQYVSLGTAYYYPKTSPARPPAGFFLPLPPCLPHSESRSLCLDAVVCPPPDAMHLGQIIFE